MDMIQTIINKKQIKNDSIDLEKLLHEVDIYTKLAVNKSFRSLSNPILKNKLPMLYSVNTNDQLLYILHELKQELLFITDYKLYLFDNLKLKNKEFFQKRVLGGINNYKITHKTLYDFGKINDAYSYVFAQTTLPNELVNVLILEYNNESITTYTGTCEQYIEGDTNINTSYNYNSVTLNTYSSRGYNDYTFAYIDEYKVSMPNKETLRYENDEYVIDKEISSLDQNALKMSQIPNKTICMLIEKYKPEER